MHAHDRAPHAASSKVTQGHVIDLGWRYDLMLWWMNFQSRGTLREVQSRIADLAQFQPGETVLAWSNVSATLPVQTSDTARAA